MIVLAINDRDVGGGAEVVFRETNRLLGMSDQDIVLRTSVPYSGPLEFVVNGAGIFNFYFAINSVISILRYRPDLVHVHNFASRVSPLTLLALKFAKRFWSFTIVHTAHDFHLTCPNTGFLRHLGRDHFATCTRCASTGRWIDVLKKKCDRRGFLASFVRYFRHRVFYDIFHAESAFDCVICPSNTLKTFLNSRFPHLRTVLLRNPGFRARQNFGIKVNNSDDSLSIAFFGRLEPEKGIRKFIEHDFDSKRYRSFAIYGGGSERKNIESIIKEKNLSAKISLKGEIAYDDVIKEMSKVDAVVLPSICYENCPLVVCDALSLGKSVISSSAGGVSELLQLAENAETEFLKASVYIENLLKTYHQEIERRQTWVRDRQETKH